MTAERDDAYTYGYVPAPWRPPAAEAMSRTQQLALLALSVALVLVVLAGMGLSAN